MDERHEPDRARVPIWIGAVGHRSIAREHEAPLRKAIGEVLDDLKTRWVGELEPCLLTSLAEGADQLVAEEALARGWKLGVPLPLPEAIYARDFGSHESLEAFRRLRAEAIACFEVGLAPGVTLELAQAQASAREAQYARAGRLLAETCPLVIALWDGEDRNLPGGTSEVIARVLSGWREERDGAQILSPQQPKVVYHVWTPSRERPDVTGVPFDWRVLTSQDSPRAGDEHLLADSIAQLAEFDRDVRSAAGDGARARSAGAAVPPEYAKTLPSGIRGLLSWYAIADSLALRHQRRVRWALPSLLVLAVLAFAGFEVHTHWHGNPPVGLSVFLAAIGLMFAAVWAIQARAHERKFLDYRALAEGLRVQLFWRLCGLPDCVSAHYLRRHRGELSWIPMAVAALSVGAVYPESADAGSAWPLGRRRRLAREHWLESQRVFFATKARAAERYARGNLVAAYALLALAIGIVLLLRLGLGTAWMPALVEHARHPIYIGIGLLLATSAALRHFVERRSYETHARRYELMHLLASRALRAIGDDKVSLESEGAEQVLREFGRESLAENGDWLLLNRERPLEVPPPA